MSADQPRTMQPLKVQRAGGAGRGGAVIKQGPRSVFIPSHLLPQIARALDRLHAQNTEAPRHVKYTAQSEGAYRNGLLR